MKKYQIGDIVKSSKKFRTIIDYDSDNHYGIVTYIGYSEFRGRTVFDVQWFDGLVSTCYDNEIKPFSIRKKRNG